MYSPKAISLITKLLDDDNSQIYVSRADLFLYLDQNPILPLRFPCPRPCQIFQLFPCHYFSHSNDFLFLKQNKMLPCQNHCADYLLLPTCFLGSFYGWSYILVQMVSLNRFPQQPQGLSLVISIATYCFCLHDMHMCTQSHKLADLQLCDVLFYYIQMLSSMYRNINCLISCFITSDYLTIAIKHRIDKCISERSHDWLTAEWCNL